MKKAVISTGNKQYLVSEGDTLEVELLSRGNKTIDFTPLLLIDGEKSEVGNPEAKEKVSATVIEPEIQTDKVTAIRYKAKKRVHKVRGHRQKKTVIKISKIS